MIKLIQIEGELFGDDDLDGARRLLRAYAEDVQRFDAQAHNTIAALFTSLSAFPSSVGEWADEYPQSKCVVDAPPESFASIEAKLKGDDDGQAS